MVSTVLFALLLCAALRTANPEGVRVRGGRIEVWTGSNFESNQPRADSRLSFVDYVTNCLSHAQLVIAMVNRIAATSTRSCGNGPAAEVTVSSAVAILMDQIVKSARIITIKH